MRIFKIPLVVFVIPLVFLLIKLVTISDYGISWDEPEHFYRGQAYLHYFKTGSTNYKNLPELTTYYQSNTLTVDHWLVSDDGHPPLNDILAAFSNSVFFQKLEILGDIEAHHLFNILVSFFAVLVVAVFGYQVGGIVVSIFSSLVFATYPLFFAESTFNIKDPAQTAFFTATIWVLWNSIKKTSWRWLLLSAFFFGLAFGTKFNILFLPFIVLVWFIVRFWPIIKKGPGYILEQIKKIPKAYYLALIISPLIIGLIFFGSWPFLWQNPVGNFLKIFGFYRAKGVRGVSQPDFVFLGFNTFPLYWIYATTYPYVLLLFLLGLLVSFKDKSKNKTLFLWSTWFILTVIRSSVPKATVYGGIRQIMEFIPALSLLSGVGANSIFQRLRGLKIKSSIAIFVLLLPFAFLFLTLYRIHPHQNVYFNSLVGGLSGAVEKKIPYAGNSFGNAYKEAYDWINENAQSEARVALVQATVLNAPEIMFRRDIERWNLFWSGLKREGEYLVEVIYLNQGRAYPYAWSYVERFLEPVYEVKVDGVAIAKVWKNDLEHTKEEMRREEIKKSVGVKIDKSATTIEADLGKREELTKLLIFFDEGDDCSEVTGIVSTSLDGESWTQEVEPVPSNQISEGESVKDGVMSYYFPATPARFVRFSVNSPNSCIFLSTEVSLYVLE